MNEMTPELANALGDVSAELMKVLIAGGDKHDLVWIDAATAAMIAMRGIMAVAMKQHPELTEVRAKTLLLAQFVRVLDLPSNAWTVIDNDEAGGTAGFIPVGPKH